MNEEKSSSPTAWRLGELHGVFLTMQAWIGHLPDRSFMNRLTHTYTYTDKGTIAT